MADYDTNAFSPASATSLMTAHLFIEAMDELGFFCDFADLPIAHMQLALAWPASQTYSGAA